MMGVDRIRIAAYAVLTIAGLALGWNGRGWKEAYDARAREQERLEQERLARELVASISRETLAAIGQIQLTNTTIYQKATHEIRTNTVYRDCRVPDDGMRLLNDARSAAD